MLFTEIAQTWDVQRDSVNTAIIHSYSTLPCNGRIHGLSEITGIDKVIRHIGFVWSKDRRLNRPGRKSWSRSSKNRCRLSETILCCVSDFNRTDCALRPSGAEEITRSTERHLVIPFATLSVVDIFSRPIFPEMTQSRTKWYWTSICLEALWWTGFFDKAT